MCIVYAINKEKMCSCAKKVAIIAIVPKLWEGNDSNNRYPSVGVNCYPLTKGVKSIRSH